MGEVIVSGSNPRPDTSYCPRDEGLTGLKTDEPFHKERRVQTIIGKVTFQTCPYSNKFYQDSISTSDRNQQNRSRKWWHSSLEGVGQYLRLMEKWRTREHDRRYLTQKRNQRGEYSVRSWKATQGNRTSAGDVTYNSAMER